MQTHLTINADIEGIREEQRDGQRYLVAQGVRIIRPMQLSSGYVPEKSIERSVSLENTHNSTGWDVPATLNHPRNVANAEWHDPSRPEDEVVLASNDGVVEALGLGQIENQSVEETNCGDSVVVADIAVNADKAEAMGGEAEDVVAELEAIQNGEDGQLDVSTQYVGTELPPGKYDGEHHAQVEAIVAPDSVAILPNKSGACSVADGCGIATPESAPVVAANSETDQELHVSAGYPVANTTGNPVWDGLGGTLRRLIDDIEQLKDNIRGSGPENDEIRQDLRTVSVDLNQALGMWQAHDEEMGGDGELPEKDDAPTRATVNEDTDTDMNSNQTMGAESPVELTANMKPTANATVELSEEELSGAIGGIWGADRLDAAMDGILAAIETDLPDEDQAAARAALENVFDAGIEATFDAIVDEAGEEDNDDAEAQAEDNEYDEPTDNDKTMLPDGYDSLEDYVDDRVSEAVANAKEEQSRKQRVETIIANSAEYDAEDKDELMDTPDTVLERIEKGVAESGINLPGASGAEPSANEGDEIELDESDYIMEVDL